MLQTLNDLLMNFMSGALNWMLYMPKDVVLGIVALVTAAALTLVRPFTTNQDLLRRCKADKMKLKRFIKDAKRKKDKEALGRYRATMAGIGMKSMKAEGKPLLYAIIPIALLALWCFGNLGYEAPVPGEPVNVRAYFPRSAIDRVGVVHIAPVEGVEATTGWAQRITEDPVPGPDGRTGGWANWQLAAEENEKPYLLDVRCQGKSYPKEMIVNGREYSPVLEYYDESPVQAVELGLNQYKPFGVVPTLKIPAKWVEKHSWLAFFSWFVLDAWIVGYLLITIPFVFLLRWSLKIC